MLTPVELIRRQQRSIWNKQKHMNIKNNKVSMHFRMPRYLWFGRQCCANKPCNYVISYTCNPVDLSFAHVLLGIENGYPHASKLCALDPEQPGRIVCSKRTCLREANPFESRLRRQHNRTTAHSLLSFQIKHLKRKEPLLSVWNSTARGISVCVSSRNSTIRNKDFEHEDWIESKDACLQCIPDSALFQFLIQTCEKPQPSDCSEHITHKVLPLDS